MLYLAKAYTTYIHTAYRAVVTIRPAALKVSAGTPYRTVPPLIKPRYTITASNVLIYWFLVTVFGIPLANRHRLIVPRCRLNTYTVVGLFRLLVRQSGTHCQMNSDSRRVMSTALNSSLKQSCSALT